MVYTLTHSGLRNLIDPIASTQKSSIWALRQPHRSPRLNRSNDPGELSALTWYSVLPVTGITELRLISILIISLLTDSIVSGPDTLLTTTRVCAHLHTPTDKSVSTTRAFKIERLRLPIVGAALANQKVTNLSLLECLKFSVAAVLSSQAQA